MSYYDDQDLLNTDDKRVGEARGVLSVLFRQLLVVLNIDGWMWDKLMRRYLLDPRNGIQNNSRDRSSARGNLNKELKRDDMTWRVFLKSLNFLDFVRVEFSIKATVKSGKSYTVTAKLKDRGPIVQPDAFEEEDDRDSGTGNDPIDEVDDLMTTTHQPSRPQQPFSADDVLKAINSRHS